MLIKDMKFSMSTKTSCFLKKKENGSQKHGGICATFFPINLVSKKNKTALRKLVSGDVSHRGIKTVDAEHGCEFSCDSDIYLRIVTWNMNGQVVDEDIEKLVGGGDVKYDILVIGLQEAPSKKISQMLESALIDTHILLGKALMQSLQLYVFGPKNSEQFIGEVKVDKQSVGGLGGLIGRKKGAVSIFITYKGIPIQLISCHLAAHARNVEERNDQFKHISHSLFSDKWNPYARLAQVTIWLGDLNYRLEGINTHPARDLIHDNLQQLLTEKDQLLQEAERGHVFKGYCEGNLAFKPTYKYNKGSSYYDTSHKVRVPSWTDRILFKIEDNNRIDASLHCYESIDSIRSSDHKPVKAHLCLSVKN